MLEGPRFGMRRLALGIADYVLTVPALRWTWTGLADDAFAGDLPEFRPSDGDAVREMMAGRYLLASKLIESGGASPFSLDVDHADWTWNLHSFSWLRHFRDVHDAGQRRFALTLVLDWIGRDGRFARDSWAPALCAQRVLNWLRHLTLLLKEANPEQTRTIQRSLGTQIQSLKVRRRLAVDPTDELFAAIALVGAELCEQGDKTDVDKYVERLDQLLDAQLDNDGMHISRNPRLQMQLLVELASIRRALGSHKSEASGELSAQVERMHESLDVLTLGSGEPVYFNGCGQLPHDVLIAVQANGANRKRKSTLLAGYGILRDGDAVVVADSGLVPPPNFAGEAHSSALAFEFSHGTELILGSCGPAPSDLPASKPLFRQGIAHSAPTVDAEDAQPLATSGPRAGRLLRAGAAPAMTLHASDHLLTLTTPGYARRFGVTLERRLTLLAGGTTLVGQDRMIASGNSAKGLLAVRFHLAPRVTVRRNRGESIVRLHLPNGTVWSFLWEGAEFHEEDSVRQSSYVGFAKTRQLVLEAPVNPGAEVAWIFTLEQS